MGRAESPGKPVVNLSFCHEPSVGQRSVGTPSLSASFSSSLTAEHCGDLSVLRCNEINCLCTLIIICVTSCAINFLFISCAEQLRNKTGKGKCIRHAREMIDNNAIVVWDCNSLLPWFRQWQPLQWLSGEQETYTGLCNRHSCTMSLTFKM